MTDQPQPSGQPDEPLGASLVLVAAVLAALLSIALVPMAQAPDEPTPRPYTAQMEINR